jgi:hypothetical protein
MMYETAGGIICEVICPSRIPGIGTASVRNDMACEFLDVLQMSQNID